MTVRESVEHPNGLGQIEPPDARDHHCDCRLTEVMPRGWAWAYQHLLNAGQEERWFVRRLP